jgi:predicted XRE-type DNA-binding protein
MNRHYKVIVLAIQKLYARFELSKSKSSTKVKVTRSKILVLIKRSCHKDARIYHSKDIS